MAVTTLLRHVRDEWPPLLIESEAAFLIAHRSISAEAYRIIFKPGNVVTHATMLDSLHAQ